MKDIQAVEEFAIDLADMCTHTPLMAERPLVWTIIANPMAGGFTIAKRWKQHRTILREYADRSRTTIQRPEPAMPSRTAVEADRGTGRLGALGLIPTLRPNHAGDLVRSLIDEALANQPENKTEAAPFYLIITAGGDGTSLETLTALYNLPPQLRNSFAILRLPMGTGNDGADARDLDKALDLLVHPSRLVFTPAVELRTAGKEKQKGPFLAFNILSVGLDAFVTHMTNKMKGQLPGDSYKLWVDIATLFYDRIYRVERMEIEAYDAQGRRIAAFEKKLLLLAFGISGRRTYGAGVPILPDDRNVCGVEEMPLLKKLKLKKLFTSGQHADRSEAHMLSAAKVLIRYSEPILAQMDGEPVLLDREDFPITLSLTEPRIPTLRLA
jgi:diacylglycerol kinase family enzyme